MVWAATSLSLFHNLLPNNDILVTVVSSVISSVIIIVSSSAVVKRNVSVIHVPSYRPNLAHISSVIVFVFFSSGR
jgi:hypothetical protein